MIRVLSLLQLLLLTQRPADDPAGGGRRQGLDEGNFAQGRVGPEARAVLTARPNR